jgi:hypothetical protein
MTVTILLEAYESGCLTARDCAVELLSRASTAELADALASAPEAVRLALERFVEEYRAGEMISLNVRVPSPTQVDAARRVLTRNRRCAGVRP